MFILTGSMRTRVGSVHDHRRGKNKCAFYLVQLRADTPQQDSKKNKTKRPRRINKTQQKENRK